MVPGLTGPWIAAAIRRSHPETLTLFTSGYSPELVSEQTGSDVHGPLLPKPFTCRDLEDSVACVLGTGAPARSRVEELQPI